MNLAKVVICRRFDFRNLKIYSFNCKAAVVLSAKLHEVNNST